MYNGPYYINQFHNGWHVNGPDGYGGRAGGPSGNKFTIYDNEADAMEMCKLMNGAYRLGRQAPQTDAHTGQQSDSPAVPEEPSANT